MELPDHGHHLVLGDELAQPRHALLRRARIVLDYQLDLAPPEDTAAGVDVLSTHLRSTHDELPGARIPRRRQGCEDTDLHRCLGWSQPSQSSAHQYYHEPHLYPLAHGILSFFPGARTVRVTLPGLSPLTFSRGAPPRSSC